MKIGFIGLGTMGEAMSANIVKKHNDKVYVFDVIREKVQKLESLGAIGCESALEVAKNVDVIITMVPRSEHAKAVYTEVLPVLKPGMICVDMSTIDPPVSLEIAQMVGEKGAKFADCPVVKSKPAAIAGELGIFAGCSEDTYNTLLPILLYMGKNVVRMGENGKGIIMKVCHNALAHEIQAAVNETLTLAQLNGIGVGEFAKAVSYGGAQNFYLESKVAAIRDRDYSLAFPVEYALKDLKICQRLAESTEFSMPTLELAISFLNKAMDMGLAKIDNSASIEAVRKGTALEQK